MWPLVTISWPAMSVNSHNHATSAENVGRAPESAQLVQDSALMAVADRAARHRRGGRRAARRGPCARAARGRGTATRPSRPDSHARSRLAAQDTRNHCSPRRAQGRLTRRGRRLRPRCEGGERPVDRRFEGRGLVVGQELLPARGGRRRPGRMRRSATMPHNCALPSQAREVSFLRGGGWPAWRCARS